MRVRIVALIAVVGLLAVACSNSSEGGGSSSTTAKPGGSTTPSSQPGVTADTIRVGGVASVTNPLNAQFGAIFDGAKAYFDMVNADGGIDGRKLELVSERDDQLGANQQQVEAMLAQDNVFAAIIDTPLFTGSQALAQAGTPTFGRNLSSEWTGHPNFFGTNYGALCLGCVGAGMPFLAREAGAKKIGIVAYSVPQSDQCAEGIEESFKKYPTAKVAFDTRSISYGTTDFTVEVDKMKDAGVDMVMTCMDAAAVVNLAKSMRKEGLDAIQYLPDGYDCALVQANGEFLEGDLVGIPFVPLEFEPQIAPVKEFEKWVKTSGCKSNENVMAGWIAGAMLVDGLKAAGKDFTQQSVVSALNKMTDQTLGGLVPPKNWTTDHEITHATTCVAYVKIKNGQFVPTFNQPGKPFLCLPDQPAQLPAEATFKSFA